MEPVTINTYLNTLQQKGYMAYEYNPFYNYQTNVPLVEVDGFLIPEGKAVDKRNGKILTKAEKNSELWKDDQENIIDSKYVITYEANYSKNGENTITKDSLINLDTPQLNFDINHPIDIEIQPSYDGSVNLILNDDKNIPRLINSRFSTREKNTYEIVDRIGENDTNIYSSDSFEKDTSLYFQYKTNPKIEYRGLINGSLPVGQYCFYFTYCDADDNESDFIAESGLIPLFIGVDGDPYSMDGGIKNQLSNKGVKLRLTKLDSSYNYLKIYYVRYFADYQQNRVYECKKIYQRYIINSNKLNIQITGNEEAEDLDPNVLNMVRFNAKSILTQAQCKNMLFLGNIVKNADNYKELQDCALRIIPKCEKGDKVESSQDYSMSSNNGYYSSFNIYNKVGYFNNEYYRFGVVYIYEDGTLSSVYSTLGYDMNDGNISLSDTGRRLYEDSQENAIMPEIRRYIKIDENGWVINEGEYNADTQLNARGVCKILKEDEGKVLKIKFVVPSEITEHLTKLGIRGLFFVRQKRVPNILGQCYLLPMDNILHAPILEVTKKDALIASDTEYKTESFVTQTIKKTEWIRNDLFGVTIPKEVTVQDGLQVENNYNKRLFTYGNNENIGKGAYAAICPDFLLNQPYYNQIFNGSKFILKKATSGAKLKQESGYPRHYQSNQKKPFDFEGKEYKAIISSVTEEVQTIALKNSIYKLEIGKAEEAYRFGYAQTDNGQYNAGDEDFDKINNSTNIVRGKYSPYLAIQSNEILETGEIYNIYQENYIEGDNQQFLSRMNSLEPFYAISDRYNWEELDSLEDSNDIYKDCYRGDCYNNVFTYRLNRNFNDSSLPNNDDIIDKNTWKENYRADDPEKFKDISRSDINAVQLGSWITIKVKSPYNYALRSEDFSYVAEAALMGSPRTFYPRKQQLWLGTYKMPDSYLYNDAYRATLGYKSYFTIQNTNYIKDTFSNRIQYSAIAIQDSFKNNYRESYSTYFRDYSSEYGSIQKLVESNGNLLVVFEHAIGIAAVNERVLAGEGEGGPVFINTQNVLPEELVIITNTYGTQWPDSVIKSEAGYVYGVDTVAKKIWRVANSQLEILSDFKVNKFLVDNISLGERELYPIVGLKNVKTHYNNNKKDIMFTFYDDIYKDEEKVWNLCYNELLGQFVTFYSWIPSFSENIDTQFFSFDRNTAKALSLLDTCNYANYNTSGVVLNSPVLSYDEDTYYTEVFYRDPSSGEIADRARFELLPDHWGNYKLFEWDQSQYYIRSGKLKLKNNEEVNYQKVINRMRDTHSKVILLEIQPIVYSSTTSLGLTGNYKPKPQTVAVTFPNIVTNNAMIENIPDLTTDFYLHGQAGIFNIKENLYPTHWYGEYHPFEFEFVVNDKIGQQKIFNDLIIVSNKAEPESFHFEIEGDNYEFSSDKRNMYFRQEATKELYQNLGSDIIYDRYYTDVAADKYTYEQYYRTQQEQRLLDDENQLRKAYNYNGRDINDNCIGVDKVYPVYSHGLVQQVKSTLFPLYYERVDTFNDIYYKYREMIDSSGTYDFKNLSGSEVKWDRDLNQFNIVTHIKNSPIDLVGRLRGNSRYKEGKWNIQIPSINFMQKNEGDWKDQQEEDSGIFIICESKLCGKDRISCVEDVENPFIVEQSILDENDRLLGYSTYKAKKDEYQDIINNAPSLPPIIINSQYIPKDLDTTEVSASKLPNIYGKYGYFGVKQDGWTCRKETRIRDKWIKVRIRYSGKNLAVIHSLITLYNISYS